jgi:hypothetical protein
MLRISSFYAFGLRSIIHRVCLHTGLTKVYVVTREHDNVIVIFANKAHIEVESCSCKVKIVLFCYCIYDCLVFR